MKVSVKHQHIQGGDRRGSSTTSPIALALVAIVGSGMFVEVFHTAFRVLDFSTQKYTWFFLPQEVVEWLALYDAGMHVKPFTFELDKDDEGNEVTFWK
jgi:hypothetical protein